MTNGQRYFFTLAPGFILIAFFLGIKAFLVLTAPVLLVYWGDSQEWSVWQFCWRLLVGLAVIFLLIGIVD